MQPVVKEITVAEKSLAYASRQELIDELFSRNMATIVMCDHADESAPGYVELVTKCYYHGPLTQLYGLVAVHGPRIQKAVLVTLNLNVEDHSKGGD